MPVEPETCHFMMCPVVDDTRMARAGVRGRPFLVVFGGLPGTGKTTLAKALASRIGAVYVRIDSIEQAMKNAGASDIGAVGYAVANDLALDNLMLGRPVVADCVNPVRESRDGWRNVAAKAGCRLANFQVICSDDLEHRRRVESRVADIPGLVLPSWAEVMRLMLEPREDAHLILDTAQAAPGELVERCVRALVDIIAAG